MTMTNIERANKVAEIESKLDPIGQKKIILETRLKFLKDNYFKNYSEETKTEIDKLREEYNLTIVAFNGLYSELRSFQKKYLVQYTGELIEPYSNTTYNRQYLEELFLRTECEIDTFANSWQPYMINADAKEVIKELYSFIYKCRFSKFSIDNIKSL